MEIKNNIYSSIEQITGHVLRGCVKTTVEEK